MIFQTISKEDLTLWKGSAEGGLGDSPLGLRQSINMLKKEG